MGKARGEGRGVALLVALLLMCALLGLTGCTANGKEATGSGTLRVGVRSDVVGFGYLNEETGKHYGLEIDIAEELAKRLGYADIEYVDVLPENRKEMLQDGKVDCLIACYSVSETRLANFDFSPAYYNDLSIVMVENSSLVGGIEQLKGMTFGAMAGSNTAPQLVIKLTELGFTSGEPLAQTEDKSETRFDTFRLVQIESYQELSRRLEEGSIDAACMDGSIAEMYLSADRSILDFSIDSQEYGVATQKDSALSKPIADAMQSMLDDGTITTLTDKWD
ncbi:MAG: transporter substrate-binding domain-containing protein [Gordonibacter sp.]